MIVHAVDSVDSVIAQRRGVSNELTTTAKLLQSATTRERKTATDKVVLPHTIFVRGESEMRTYSVTYRARTTKLLSSKSTEIESAIERNKNKIIIFLRIEATSQLAEPRERLAS